jgi:hypothetical protein
MTKLIDEFIRANRVITGLTASMSMMLMTKQRVEEFEQHTAGNPTLKSLCSELEKRLRLVKRPEDFTAMNQVYETYAEANTLLILSQRGVKLDRTPGTGQHKQKRPDFVHHHPSGDIYFEVKALEIADSLQRHKVIANDGLEVAADLAERAKKGGVHFGELSVSGHKPGASASERVDDIAKRIKNVIKREQIQFGPTVLVVDLGRLPICPLGPSQLLPVFFHDDAPAEACVSGELWQIALGAIGEQIFELPECDGKSNLGGRQNETGVLCDFPSLMAITFQLPRWNEPPELHTIWNLNWDRASLVNQYKLHEQEVEQLLHGYSDGLNDNHNELGWPYRVVPLRPSKSTTGGAKCRKCPILCDFRGLRAGLSPTRSESPCRIRYLVVCLRYRSDAISGKNLAHCLAHWPRRTEIYPIVSISCCFRYRT